MLALSAGAVKLLLSYGASIAAQDKDVSNAVTICMYCYQYPCQATLALALQPCIRTNLCGYHQATGPQHCGIR